MTCRRLCPAVVAASAVMVLADAGLLAQTPFPLSDKVRDLAGKWKRDPGWGAGGICGVSDDDVIAFEIVTEPPSVFVRSRRVNGRVPLDGASVAVGVGAFRTVVAAPDAGWLKLTMTMPRNGGFTNVMQEVYILNRHRSELTVWRTLNTVLPDGSSGKIDCGNRAAIVYVRQSAVK